MNTLNEEQSFIERLNNEYMKAREYRDFVEQENPHRDCFNPLTAETIKANATVFCFPITFSVREMLKAILQSFDKKMAKGLLTTIL